MLSFIAGVAVLFLAQGAVRAAEPAAVIDRPPTSLKYLWARAYHIPPQTTTEESGYFSLCEGKNGRIYIGCAAYGRDSYLVEFDPATERMRIVLDTHKLVGLPLGPTGYRDLGPILRDQPNTLIDKQGRATAITRDYQVARYGPAAGKATVDPLLVDGKPFREVVGPDAVHPDWRLAADGRTAYLQLLNDLRMFEVDLGGEAGRPVAAKSPGNRGGGKNPDSRGPLSTRPEGRGYTT